MFKDLKTLLPGGIQTQYHLCDDRYATLEVLGPFRVWAFTTYINPKPDPARAWILG
jgi:hypothetical protein